MKKLSNRGITIVEVVISMAIISIISSVAVTIAISSIKTSNKNTIEFNASNVSADIISLYRASDTKDTFKGLLSKTYFIEFQEDNSSTEEVKELSFAFENIKYEITWDDFDKKIMIKASRANNGKKIYETSYSKGGEYYENKQTQ